MSWVCSNCGSCSIDEFTAEEKCKECGEPVQVFDGDCSSCPKWGKCCVEEE